MTYYHFIAVLIFGSIIYKPTVQFYCDSYTITNYNCTILPNQKTEGFYHRYLIKGQNISIHVAPGISIVIRCLIKITNWDDQYLPLMEIGYVDDVVISECPIPTRGASSISKTLGFTTNNLVLYGGAQYKDITLTSSYLDGIHEVMELSLIDNGIINIDIDAFSLPHEINNNNTLQSKNGFLKRVSMLRDVRIRDNQLSYLPDFVFQDLTELRTLAITGNKLTSISGNAFKNLRNLRKLDLSKNEIEYLSTSAFYELENLIDINLIRNKLKEVPENLFIKNNALLRLQMTNNRGLAHIPSNLFSNLTELKSLQISKCKLLKLRSNLFYKSVHLQIINLSRNDIKHIPKDIFKFSVELLKLNLAYNKIENLPDKVFAPISRLEFLNLEGNSITQIAGNFFNNLHNLKMVKLKNNEISSIHVNLFQETEINLKDLDVSYNKIITLNWLQSSNHYLQKVDLSHNHLSDLRFEDVAILHPMEIDLTYNNISLVNFSYAYDVEQSSVHYDNQKQYEHVLVHLNGNPIRCDCNIYHFARYLLNKDSMSRSVVLINPDTLSCADSRNVEGAYLTTLELNTLTCSLQQSQGCARSFRSWDSALIINCTYRNFTEAPILSMTSENIFNQTEVHLEYNLLTSGPEEHMGYENVTKLFLSSNNISKIVWIPSNIQVLELHNNNISHLGDNVLSLLKSSPFNSVTLGNNPWTCDCSSAMNLTAFLTLHAAKKRVDVDNVTCKVTGKPLVDTIQDLCLSPGEVIEAMLIGSSSMFVGISLSLFLLTIFYYRNKHEIKVWLFAHNMCMWFVTEEEVDKDKVYDAFISYSHKDEKFVLKDLLSVLEQKPDPYKICLHIRDWIVGEDIAVQITRSVEQSRRTLVILSPNFLESVWSKMEFRTAHIQAMKEGRTRVIIILYQDVNVDEHEELKAYIKTHTYAKWNDPLFWDKLRYALPHSRTQSDHEETTTD